MSRVLRRAFGARGRGKRALFLPYVCVGYPTFALSLATARAALDAGADALELGVPFSDPIADGPTLQKATHASLKRGTRVQDVFRIVRTLRREGYRQPLLVMSYLNPLERMGWDRFASRLRDAGGDGVIVPDLPLEDMRGPVSILKKKDLCVIPFLSPTSSPERMRRVEHVCAPFLYYVSVTGVTGARRELGGDLPARLAVLKRRMRTPVVVGFGISGPRQAALVGRQADGVIIASALIDLIDRTPARRITAAVENFCRRVVQAMERG